MFNGNNLNEINSILTFDNIYLAHNYLKELDKTKYNLNYFINQILEDFTQNQSMLTKFMHFLKLW